MRFSSLPPLEAAFLSTGNNGEYSLKRLSVPVKDENLTLEGMLCTPVARTGYFHAVEHPKERILLHFTVGQIRSDMSALTRQDFHVSVPFVIGRNGTIYQLYSSKHWSGNIGDGIGNGGNAEDKKTIAIEISNYGFLTEKDGNLETIYSRAKDAQGRTGPADVYCSLQDKEAYQKIDAPFRGQSYYATFTNEQYESLIVLLRYLTAQFNIPRQFLPEEKRFLPTRDVLNFKGIVSHVNYRESGKWDLGPAFDWARVIKGVQAATFQPSVAVSRDIASGDDVIRSEEELETLVPAGRGIEAESASEELQDIDGTEAFLEALEAQNEKNEKKVAKRPLYALIVGIDGYRADIVLEGTVRFPKLSGCVGDAQKMASYLKEQDGFELKLKTLFNSEATKEAVVEGFQKHLGKAEKGDTVLFYYSGHGTQEWADKEAWTSDGDGRLECLACYYDEGTKDKFLLADKELRYLLKGLSDTGAHVVALFDCCHSGDNTRNGLFATSSFEQAVEKRIPFSFKQRPWEDFIFSSSVSRNRVQEVGEGEALPEGLHVQLSACESDESAMEVAGEGVFTKALLHTLQTAKGDVTYQALRSRVRQYLRNIYEQKPRIYVVNGDEALLYSLFLNRGAGEKSQAYGDVLYNEQTGWQLSRGAIHGLGENMKEVRVIDAENGNKEYRAALGEIKTDTTLLRLPKNARLDTKKVYKGYVENLLAGSLRVSVNNADGLPPTQQALMGALTRPPNGFVKLDEKAPQYTVHNSDGLLYITAHGDAARPLVRQVKAAPESVPWITACLKQIAQWEHLKGLANRGDNKLGGDEIDVKISTVKNGKKNPVAIEKNAAVIDYQKGGGRWQTELEIELKNNTGTPLYCAALYLTYDFASISNLLPREVAYLEPGNSVKLQYDGSEVIPFMQRKEVEWYNWPERTEYLKLIVSTTDFDAAALGLKALAAPAIPGADRGGGLPRSMGRDTDTAGISGWGTQTVAMRQPNPDFNKADEGKVRQMMDDERTAAFALALYFDVTLNKNRQPVYKLKRFVTRSPKKRGFVGDTVLDLANWWARRKRNRLYDETKALYPDRLRIVSEGDSWFQHPLVYDIIDHLSKTYAVYCCAAAGDTLRNMQGGKEKRGEYYLNAIEEQKPAYFLISGGGNDILGAQFRNYLNDKFDSAVEEGKTPERFLREAIFKEMGLLADIYRQLFRRLKDEHPQLRIIVHGYDYPVKLNDAKKGWLGRYMIEKGIGRPGDRKAIIRYIMDEFNRRLKEVAVEFDNVSYLDLRGIVRYNPDEMVDQWYDEIHPNDDGFQQIAMKYMERISEKERG